MLKKTGVVSSIIPSASRLQCTGERHGGKNSLDAASAAS